jgi:hypothetical protein
LRSGSEGNGLRSFPWCFGGHCHVVAGRLYKYRTSMEVLSLSSRSKKLSASFVSFSNLKRRIAREKGDGQRKDLKQFQADQTPNETFKYVGRHV